MLQWLNTKLQNMEDPNCIERKILTVVTATYILFYSHPSQTLKLWIKNQDLLDQKIILKPKTKSSDLKASKGRVRCVLTYSEHNASQPFLFIMVPA